MEASAWVSPAATTSAQWVSPRHSRRQLTACQPDSSGSEGRGMPRWAAKNTRPTRAAASTTAHRSGPNSTNGSMMPGAWVASPSATASSRACPHPVNPSASRRSNTAAMADGLMEPKAAVTAADPPAPGVRNGRRCNPAARPAPRAGRPPRSGRRLPDPRRSSPTVVCTERALRTVMAGQSVMAPVWSTPTCPRGRAGQRGGAASGWPCRSRGRRGRWRPGRRPPPHPRRPAS